jgi:hypothetical protein
MKRGFAKKVVVLRLLVYIVIYTKRGGNNHGPGTRGHRASAEGFTAGNGPHWDDAPGNGE